jgi:hypothetical protein
MLQRRMLGSTHILADEVEKPLKVFMKIRAYIGHENESLGQGLTVAFESALRQENGRVDCQRGRESGQSL